MEGKPETGRGVEILPLNFGELKSFEAAPIAERAVRRMRVLGRRNPGIEDNLSGFAAWVRGHKAVAKRTVLAVAGAAFIAGCARGVEGAYLPPTETVSTATAEIALTQTLAPPPETQESYQGISNPKEILAIPGTPEGFGGIGTTEKVSNSSEKQQALNEQGYAPILGPLSQLSWEISEEGTALCAVNIPEKIYNPYVESGEDLKISSGSGIVNFGDPATGEIRTEVLSVVPISGYPESFSCVAAVVIDENNPAGLGAIRLLLIKQGSGEIMGEMPGAFAGEDDVRFEWAGQTPKITVNGQELQFEMREGAVESVPEDRWQLSPDGRIAFNEAELYEGMFTVTEDSEITHHYWEEILRGLYNINKISRNNIFLSRFPTVESFLKGAEDGSLISNLRIPVQYPPAGKAPYDATWTEVETVDLSTIAIAIAKPTYQEIIEYSALKSPYYEYFVASGRVLIERVEIDNQWLLKFTLQRGMLSDNEPYNILALYDDYSDKHNLIAANQLVRTWLYVINFPTGWEIYYDYDPPLLRPGSWNRDSAPREETFLRMQDPEGALLKIR